MPEVTSNPQVNTPGPIQAAPAGSKRNFVVILIGVAALVVAAVAICIGYKALTSAPSSTSPTTGTTTAVSEIKTDADFQKLENELNNTNLDTLTKDLDQNDADAATF